MSDNWLNRELLYYYKSHRDLLKKKHCSLHQFHTPFKGIPTHLLLINRIERDSREKSIFSSNGDNTYRFFVHQRPGNWGRGERLLVGRLSHP